MTASEAKTHQHLTAALSALLDGKPLAAKKETSAAQELLTTLCSQHKKSSNSMDQNPASDL